MRSGVIRIRVRFRRSWRMISCAAAVGIRYVNPSRATESPSSTISTTASRKVVTSANYQPPFLKQPPVGSSSPRRSHRRVCDVVHAGVDAQGNVGSHPLKDHRALTDPLLGNLGAKSRLPRSLPLAKVRGDPISLSPC